MTVMPPADGAPTVEATEPTDAEIMEVLGLTHASTEQLGARMRELFRRRTGVGLRRQKTLEEYQAEIREINEANGWYEDERAFGDDIALTHTEVSEMYEAYRNWLFEDKTPACNCPVSTSGVRGLHHNTECAMWGKPEGVGSEAADVLIRLLDTCERHKIDLRFEVERKLRYNRKRGYKHGGKHV